ncbi:hypothetical protein GGR73_003298 [Xanthomonas sp. F14]|uniref:hypothetical protein n=1 Tax=Xanthomonas arboricola TaxID=56448 RepID=UPI00161FF4B1
MKASRQAKLETQLAATESELLELLMDALPYTAQHGDMIFFNSAFHPDYVRPHQISERNEQLLSLSSQGVALREEIGLPVLGSVGQLFLSACSEASNSANENRRGPSQLAAWLVGKLGPNNSFKPNPLRGSA